MKKGLGAAKGVRVKGLIGGEKKDRGTFSGHILAGTSRKSSEAVSGDKKSTGGQGQGKRLYGKVSKKNQQENKK